MTALPDFQPAMRRLALGSMPEDRDPFVSLLNRADAGIMVEIHRNTVRLTLRDALAANFPATLALVGADFFGSVADDFIVAHPPSDPRLGLFGAGFDRWLSDHPGLEEFPFVTDVARLEIAWSLAYRSDPISFAGRTDSPASIDPPLFRNPSATLVRSRFDTPLIRRTALAGLALDENMVRPSRNDALVLRRAETVVIEPLAAAEADALENAWNDKPFNPTDLARAMALGAYITRPTTPSD